MIYYWTTAADLLSKHIMHAENESGVIYGTLSLSQTWTSMLFIIISIIIYFAQQYKTAVTKTSSEQDSMNKALVERQ